ncbi:MAG: hypothetical protein Q7S51_12100, partial [Gallionellaceae bacterium]|nr:hypothetical protein [Gallionellaceae bacterium]
ALSWSFQTLERPRDWRNFETVIATDMRAYPGYYMPVLYKVIAFQLPQGQYRDALEIANKLTDLEYRNLMVMMIEASYAVHVKASATGNPQEAMGHLWNWGLKLKQPPARARWNLPVNLLWEKNQGVLKDEWKYLVAHFPDNELIRYNFSLWLLNENMYEDAITHLRIATESKRLPESIRGTAYKNLGLALLYTGHAAEAEISLRTATEQLSPDMRAHCLLAIVYKKTRQFEEAARAETNCAKLPPNRN